MSIRPIKPRSRDMYDNEAHGRRESNVPSDDRTLRTDLCRVNLVRPKYKEGPLIIRPWPALSYEQPDTPVPGRKSTRAHSQSHWIVRAPAVRYIGLEDCEKFTFLLYAPWEAQDQRNNNPVNILYRAARAAYRAGQFGPGRKWDSTWNRFMVGDDQGGAQLSAPTALWFMQASVFINGDKDYSRGGRLQPLGWDSADELVVVQLPAGAGDRLLTVLDTPASDAGEIPPETDKEPWKFFKFGDPVGVFDKATGTINGGLIIGFFNPRKVRMLPPRKPGEPPCVDLAGNRRPLTTTSWNGEMPKFAGYEVALMRKFAGSDGTVFSADLTAQQVQRVRDTWQFWWDDPESGDRGLLYIPSVEEQMVLLARAFRTAPKLLEFAFADHPEYMTQDVRGILAQRRSVVVPEADEADDDGGAGVPAPVITPRTDPTQKAAAPVPADEDDEFASPQTAQAEDVAQAEETTDDLDEIGGDDFDEQEEVVEQDKAELTAKDSKAEEPDDEFPADLSSVRAGSGEEAPFAGDFVELNADDFGKFEEDEVQSAAPPPPPQPPPAAAERVVAPGVRTDPRTVERDSQAAARQALAEAAARARRRPSKPPKHGE